MIRRHVSSFTAVAVIAGALSPMSVPAHAAGMMRVEVEVYKGPVGESIEVQVGEVAALLAETVRTLQGHIETGYILIDKQKKDGVCRLKDDVRDQKDNLPTDFRKPTDCIYLQRAVADAVEALTSICAIQDYRLLAFIQKDPENKDHNPSENVTEVFGDLCSRQNDMVVKALVDDDRPVLADTRPNSTPTLFREELAKSGKSIEENYADLGRRLATITAMMQAKAYRIHNSMVGAVPSQKVVRGITISIAYTLAEYSNQISARARILMTLGNCIEKAREEAPASSPEKARRDCVSAGRRSPTSAYLRNASASHFVEAFSWYDAAKDGIFGSPGIDRDDRIRAVQALTRDYYWEKINEVYASGTGDVSMAFVKDELGNWNLRSYSNDPVKLLRAFNDGARALISLATDAASGGATIAGRKGLLALANQAMTGQGLTQVNLGGLDLATLRDRTRARLQQAKTAFVERKAALEPDTANSELAKAQSVFDAAKTSEAEKQRAAIVADKSYQDALVNGAGSADVEALMMAQLQARTELTSARTQVQSAADRLAVLRDEHDRLTERAADTIARILQDHQADLLTLQQGAAGALGE